jgi:hypothetical protein
MADRLIEDGTWNTPQPTGPKVFTYPFEGDDTSAYFDQQYQVKAENFTKAATSSAHGTLAGYYLVGESPTQDVGNGILQWTRRYSKIPSDRNEYEMFGYNFIGYLGVWGSEEDNVSGRPRRVQNVLSRLAFTYFLVDPALASDDAPNKKYKLVTSIPLLTAQTYKSNGIDADFLHNNPPYTSSSTPSRTTYEGWVTGGTEIVVEDSGLRRWQGNIWERVTRYVKAK